VTFEVLTAMKMSMFFCTVTSRRLVGRNQRLGEKYYLSPEDGGSMFLRNVGIYLQVDKALLPRRLRPILMRRIPFWGTQT
jgi:hypothetical protein